MFITRAHQRPFLCARMHCMPREDRKSEAAMYRTYLCRERMDAQELRCTGRTYAVGAWMRSLPLGAHFRDRFEEAVTIALERRNPIKYEIYWCIVMFIALIKCKFMPEINA